MASGYSPNELPESGTVRSRNRRRGPANGSMPIDFVAEPTHRPAGPQRRPIQNQTTRAKPMGRMEATST